MVRQARRPTDQGIRATADGVACTRTRLAFSRLPWPLLACRRMGVRPAWGMLRLHPLTWLLRVTHTVNVRCHLGREAHGIRSRRARSLSRRSHSHQTVLRLRTSSQLTPFVFLLLRKTFPLCHHTNLLDHKQWFAPQLTLLFQSSCSSAVPSYFHRFTATPSRPNFASFSSPHPQRPPTPATTTRIAK